MSQAGHQVPCACVSNWLSLQCCRSCPGSVVPGIEAVAELPSVHAASAGCRRMAACSSLARLYAAAAHPAPALAQAPIIPRLAWLAPKQAIPRRACNQLKSPGCCEGVPCSTSPSLQAASQPNKCPPHHIKHPIPGPSTSKLKPGCTWQRLSPCEPAPSRRLGLPPSWTLHAPQHTHL